MKNAKLSVHTYEMASSETRADTRRGFNRELDAEN